MNICDAWTPKDWYRASKQAKQNNCPNYNVYPRIYLQFNDLVFNGVASVNTAALSGDYKINTTSYPFRNGSYYGASLKDGSILMGEQDLSLDITLPFIRMTRLQALDYNQHIQYNLSKPGKLWALNPGGILIWANAIPKHPSYTDYELRDGRRLHMSMDFLLPDGVWHIANTAYVYLEPFDQCDFKDYLGTGCSYNCNAQVPCETTDCNLGCGVTEDMSYCNNFWNPYDECESEYRIIYDCGITERFIGNKVWGEEFMSTPKCILDDDCVSGQFCSNGTMNSPITVTLVGHMVNPRVEINGVRIRAIGEYDGRLVFYPDGRIRYYAGEPISDLACRTLGELIPYEDIEYIDNKITFNAYRGINLFQVIYAQGTTGIQLVYISVDELVG